MPLLPLKEVAARTEKNLRALQRNCAAKKIPCRRLGRDFFVDEKHLPMIAAMKQGGANRAKKSLRKSENSAI